MLKLYLASPYHCAPSAFFIYFPHLVISICFACLCVFWLLKCDRCGKYAKPGVFSGTNGCVHALKTLVRAEGLLRLWRGVPTMFVGCIPAHAAYFSIFEEVNQLDAHPFIILFFGLCRGGLVSHVCTLVTSANPTGRNASTAFLGFR